MFIDFKSSDNNKQIYDFSTQHVKNMVTHAEHLNVLVAIKKNETPMFNCNGNYL